MFQISLLNGVHSTPILLSLLGSCSTEVTLIRIAKLFELNQNELPKKENKVSLYCFKVLFYLPGAALHGTLFLEK